MTWTKIDFISKVLKFLLIFWRRSLFIFESSLIETGIASTLEYGLFGLSERRCSHVTAVRTMRCLTPCSSQFLCFKCWHLLVEHELHKGVYQKVKITSSLQRCTIVI